MFIVEDVEAVVVVAPEGDFLPVFNYSCEDKGGIKVLAPMAVDFGSRYFIFA